MTLAAFIWCVWCCALGAAGSIYGIVQAGRARRSVEVTKIADRMAREAEAGAAALRTALRRANERAYQFEDDLLAERRSHATTKGNYTKLKNRISAQEEAAAKVN